MDQILTGYTTLDKSAPGSNSNEGVPHIPQALKQEPHYQMKFNVILRLLNGSSQHINSCKYCYLTPIILFDINNNLV